MKDVKNIRCSPSVSDAMRRARTSRLKCWGWSRDRLELSHLQPSSVLRWVEIPLVLRCSPSSIIFSLLRFYTRLGFLWFRGVARAQSKSFRTNSSLSTLRFRSSLCFRISFHLLSHLLTVEMQIFTIAPAESHDRFPTTEIILPDLVSHCNFRIRVNRHRKQASAASKIWLFRGDNLSSKKRQAFHGLKAGLLTSMCYPRAGYPQLRVCCDFMNCKNPDYMRLNLIIERKYLPDLFHLDNLSDDMDRTSTQTIADVVLNSLYHPTSYHSSSRVSCMTKE